MPSLPGNGTEVTAVTHLKFAIRQEHEPEQTVPWEGVGWPCPGLPQS